MNYMFNAAWFFLLCYTTTMKVSCQPPEYIVQDTEQYPVLCRVQTQHGFYVYNPLALLKTENRYDCVLACKRHEQCQTSNFVRKSKLCFLHNSKLNSVRQAIRRDLVPSILSILHCGEDTAPGKDQTAGIPAETCGTPHFPPGDLTSFENRRFRRILGGFISQPYAYPWLGIVLRNNYHTCSLSLVSRNRNDKSTIWAISAAHCFMDQAEAYAQTQLQIAPSPLQGVALGTGLRLFYNFLNPPDTPLCIPNNTRVIGWVESKHTVIEFQCTESGVANIELILLCRNQN